VTVVPVLTEMIDLEQAVFALACHFAVAGPPEKEHYDKARGILAGCRKTVI
jgi:hypothetical protein